MPTGSKREEKNMIEKLNLQLFAADEVGVEPEDNIGKFK